MSSKRLKRIANEIKELEESSNILEQSGIYFHYNEDNMNIIYAMMVGPEDTPYEKGFYFFKFEYPNNYPMEPPVAKYCTQGLLRNPVTNTVYHVRFNPNLYICGKVCLSMLNTWSGPGWVPTNTISNVLVAIQALVLNELPLQNEPGFEFSARKELQKYNEIIAYANIKIGVLEMLNNPPLEFGVFKEVMHKNFKKNIEFYKKYISTKNNELKDSIIESPAYGMKLCTDYEPLLYEIGQLEDTILNYDFNKKMEITDET
jgi:ubiquitin-protein ligase